MSRINGKKPPKPLMNSAQPRNMSFEEVRAVPKGSEVFVRLTNGNVVTGKLIIHDDYLVGCPVVDVPGRGAIGIGYEGDVMAIRSRKGVS